MDISSLVGVGFSACCCVAFFLAVFAILTMLMRPRRPRREDIDGLPPAPVQGQPIRASLTRLEDGAHIPAPDAPPKGPPAKGPPPLPKR